MPTSDIYHEQNAEELPPQCEPDGKTAGTHAQAVGAGLVELAEAPAAYHREHLIPEPITATLSLPSLVGLAVRRHRK